ncbi:MAG: carbon-nitrogen hydrolase family protein [Acidobacteria bacterium]|nr:MAG: carbon-nitrogen hydrolase family protein [Acidobacteriota bacterium]REK10133.1 MAG: carbon-nitrogen hydrolase family protein [Acidobacteriota bacterium]
MTQPFLAAAVQLNATSDHDRNWRQAEELIARAASYGARFVATPEASNFLGPHDEKVRRAETLDGPVCSQYAELAARLGILLLLGSFNERLEDEHGGEGDTPRRCYNTSVLFAPDGTRLATYRKLHLFDVDVSRQLRFSESATTAAGAEPVVVETPLGTLGLTICYDLRFPELYRELTDRGAEILMVPSAFTETTGRAHWTALLRARAIECQCWLIAPGQHGDHDDDGLRHSYGHSSIVDPWGQVVACAADGPGLALAEVDLGRISEVRRRMPVASHRRLPLPG